MTAPRTRLRPAAGRRTRPGPEGAAERGLLLRLLSLLLQYPDAELTAERDALTATVHALPPSTAAGHLAAFAAWFADRPSEELESHYVEVFDLRRKSSLYLTYYLHGDTRRRGMALLALAQTYRAAGWSADSGELPDHLPVVLEFAALAGPRTGEAPLRRHRRGLDLIHHALSDVRSPYAGLLAALLSLLPPPGADDLEAVAKLAAEGPPAEDVGLDPYGGTGFAPPGTFVPPPPAPPTLIPPLTGPMDSEPRR
ncbi:nitrate reductase molybdenum cofactor assembly chaperone [Streptomyces sp. NPDC018019]|uniref:nitrate reductase molybdenum cofactor assembly chaperone n=1 Tax=Streptomyces sp. NPDC018019 TaxID=3365030 RepID=UPI00379A8390